MVATLLGKPDSQAQNPHIGFGRPMRLFAQRRVLDAEKEDRFATAHAKAKLTSTLAKMRFIHKAAFLVDLSKSLEIVVPALSYAELRKLTETEFGIVSDCNIQTENELSLLISQSKQPEWDLDAYYWHQGIRQARKTLRQRVLAKIIETYPSLANAALARARLEIGSTE